MTKPQVVVMNKFLVPTAELINSTLEVINFWEIDTHKALNNVRGMISCAWDTIDAEVLSLFPNLEIISHMAAGIDAVNTKITKARQIVVTNTPDIVTDDAADLAMGLLIALSRNILINDHYVRSSLWGQKNYLLSSSLKNKKIGIVGLGKIGLAVAKRAEAFNLNIAYFSRKKKNHINYDYYEDIEAMAKAVDFLVITCAGNEETKNLINSKILHALGKYSYLINVARGFVVNQLDLIDALQNNVIAGAGLDVFESEPNVPEVLFQMNNVILQPHAGTATTESRHLMYQLVADNLINYFETGSALTPVYNYCLEPNDEN